MGRGGLAGHKAERRLCMFAGLMTGITGFGVAEAGLLILDGVGSGSNLLNPGNAFLSLSHNPSRTCKYSAKVLMVKYLCRWASKKAVGRGGEKAG
jgi:hypothetical protein